MRLHARVSIVAPFLLCLHAFAQSAPAPAPAPNRVTLDTFLTLVRVADPQISPDGKSIVVVVSRPNLKDDRTDSQLVLVDVASHAQTVLTQGKTKVGFPRWSPTGDRLAYIAADADKHPEVFVLPMHGGDSMQLTHNEGGVQQFAWSPDGAAIAYASSDDKPKREKNDDVFEVGMNDYLVDGQSMPTHLWMVASGGGTPRRLTSGDWSLPNSFPPGAPASPINFSPDGKQLFYVRAASPLSGDAERTSLQVLDVVTGESHPVTTSTALEQYPLVSPDGKHVALWFPRDGKQWNENEVNVLDYTGGKTPVAAASERVLTKAIDRNIERSIWMPGSKEMLVGANDGDTVSLWLQPLDGTAKKLDLGSITPASAFWVDVAVGAKGEIAFTGSTKQRPSELYFKSRPDAAPVRLTDFNAAAEALQLARVETLHWPTADAAGKPDGMEADGILTYPSDYAAGKKYPLVLYIHGGPTAASHNAFSLTPQLFAAQGWLVFEPNYRGSDNLGNKYQSSIWNDAGAGPGRDVMAGVALLKARGIVDESKVAVSGWSYGGYMTTWLLGNYGGWKAAVAGAAVTDWVDMYDLGDGVTTIGDNFGGSPNDAERLKLYRAQSPITYARNIKAPTLILSDTADARVPIVQSYRLFHILKEDGVTTRFFAYPIPGHSPSDPVRARDVRRRWMEWLATYLNDAPVAADAPKGAGAQ
jgi:dipeptidyl aminopeptidase/acylaminoacyl peptidase